MVPPVTMVPTLIFGSGLNNHYFLAFKTGTSTPLGTKTESDYSAIVFKGLWIPSKISPKIPGPNKTDKGYLVLNTGSPTVKPEVSS